MTHSPQSSTSSSSFGTMVSVIVLIAMCYLLAVSGCTDIGSGTGPDDSNAVDSVSFADDVLPIFQSNCAGPICHNPGAQNGLSLASYASLSDGTSQNGPVIIPGNADSSHLVRRLEGTAQPSMPFGQPMLDEDAIKLIRDWIDQGALDN